MSLDGPTIKYYQEYIIKECCTLGTTVYDSNRLIDLRWSARYLHVVYINFRNKKLTRMPFSSVFIHKPMNL